MAIYGHALQIDGQLIRVNEWIDTIPSGLNVYVGHMHMSDFITEIHGDNGGRVVLMDTGSGKGGTLSSLDVPFGDPDWKPIVPDFVCDDGSPLLSAMVGPSGSGKSTYARDRFGAHQVSSSDEIRSEFLPSVCDMSGSARQHSMR